MAAVNQVEGALALADAAVAEVIFGAMFSSRKYVQRVMVVDDMAGVEKRGTERFSHSTLNSSSGVMPFVTMKQEPSRAATSRTRFSRRRPGSDWRYFVSDSPMICTRFGLMYS